MADTSEIKEDMTVVDSEGEHVGTVDHLDGDNIKLTKNDSEDGQHHYVPVSAVESVDGDEVRLNITADEALGEDSDEDDDSEADIEGGNGA